MLAILILFVTGLCTMFASFSTYKSFSKYLAIAGVLIAIVTLQLRLGLGLNYAEFYTMFDLTRYMTVIALIILLVIFILPRKYDEDYDWSAVYSLMLFSACGVLLLFGQTNLLTLFLGIEIMSIPLYVLAASKRNQAASLEAGLKYFILGAFASAFLLFGIALVYGGTNSFVMARIMEVQAQFGDQVPIFFHVGYLFILVAILFKMAVAPFHYWSPDVYDGSPTIVTTFMTTVVKLGSSLALYFLLFYYFRAQAESYTKFLVPIIAISLLLGAILGLVQKNIKRMLAYSSISHIGFVVAAILFSITQDDKSLFIFYLLTYTISSLLVLSILDSLVNGNSVFLDHLHGLKNRAPILAVGLGIGILSMAGIPFTGGFVAKYGVLSRMYQMNPWLLGLALLSSAIAIGYYLKIINHIFFSANNQENVASQNFLLHVVVVILAILIIILGIMPNLILQAIQTYFLL